MFIDLESVFNNVGSSKDVKRSFALEDEKNIAEDILVDGVVRNRAGIVSFEGKAEYTLSAVCDRCAEPFERKTEIEFSHTLVNELNEQDNDEYILIENMRLDVEELIRDDVLLSFPTQLLCREDCKGLCHICGQNLNEKQCGCKEPVDPRLAALMQLLEEDD